MQAEIDGCEQLAKQLRRRGLNEIAAALFESAGPLNVFLAQLVYASGPFLSFGTTESLARALEDPAQVRRLVTLLREEEEAL